MRHIAGRSRRTGIFHEKTGIVEDKTGERVAFNGSINETAAGWTRNWESFNVFTSWSDRSACDEEEANFAKLWADQAEARHHAGRADGRARRSAALPTRDDVPARLEKDEQPPEARARPAVSLDQHVRRVDLRRAVWEFMPQRRPAMAASASARRPPPSRLGRTRCAFHGSTTLAAQAPDCR